MGKGQSGMRREYPIKINRPRRAGLRRRRKRHEPPNDRGAGNNDA
jgi:hypothetical protein